VTTADIDRCDWIVVGHSHFDHLWGAEKVALATGARIIGSYETVRIMEAQGVPVDQMIPVAGGERIRLGPDVVVSVYPSQHSCVWTHKGFVDSGEVCVGDLGVLWHERQERLAELWTYLADVGDEARAHLRVSNQGDRGDGGALVYVFDTPEGRLLFQDTSGHWSGVLRDLRPDVAILAAAGRGNTDGEPTQGTLAQFVARQAEVLAARRVVLGHHDDWLPGFTIDTDVEPIRAELARLRPRCELLEMGYDDKVAIFDGLS
jgi:L-ascorbate metabolism protein UlaG (beta-lactamase superfamily)